MIQQLLCSKLQYLKAVTSLSDNIILKGSLYNKTTRVRTQIYNSK